MFSGLDPKVRGRLLILGGIAAVLVIVAIGFTIYQQLNFKIVGTEPSLSKVTDISPYLKIDFNREVSASGLDVSSRQPIIASAKTHGKTLEIDFKPSAVKAGQHYSVQLRAIHAKNGRRISNKTFSFTAKKGKVKQLPKKQKKQLIKRQSQFTSSMKDPMLRHLPYSNLDFRMEPIIHDSQQPNKTTLTLDVHLLLPPNTSDQQAKALVSKYKKEAQDYIKSFNLNPANYDIHYHVVHESLSGV
jgi:hypothetical protein